MPENAEAQSAESTVAGYADANQALAEGTELLDTGETEKAIEALKQAVALNPDLAEAYFKLGIAYSLLEIRDQTLEKVEAVPASDGKKRREESSPAEKAFENAVAAYKKIVKQNDQDHMAFFNLGRSYNKLNEDEDAADALKEAVKLNPEDAEYQTELGAILIKLAQYQEAIGPLKKAIELDPGNIKAEELLADAEAGRKRVTYTTVKKDSNSSEKRSEPSNSNTQATSDGTSVQAPANKTVKPQQPLQKSLSKSQ